ncbi:hypothetical protein GBF38_018030, partial [Nibea albiflora]
QDAHHDPEDSVGEDDSMPVCNVSPLTFFLSVLPADVNTASGGSVCTDNSATL